MTPPHAELYSSACHEAGHAVAFKAAGVRIYHVTLWAVGDFAHGACEVDEETIGDIEPFLIAILAGREAQARWLVKRSSWWLLGSARDVCPAKDDRKKFKHYAQSTGHTEAQIRPKAEKFVASNWSKIERLGNKLAKNGKITTWDL